MGIIRSIFLTSLLLVTVVTTGEAKTFKISTSAPNGSYWMNQMREGAEEIKKLTNGRVKFKFYAGGVMGSETVALKKIKIRQLHGAAVTNGVLETFFPDSQVYGLPMLFNDYAEVDYVRSSFDKDIIDGLDKAGMISFGLSEGGFMYAMSNNRIENIPDLLNKRVWTPTNNEQAEMTLKSFGINPVPLNIADVFTGLQTNIIDTIAASPIAAIALQWHTQIKYLTKLPLAYVYATMIVNKEEFLKISEEDQKIVKDIMRKVFNKIDRKNREDNENALEALRTTGIEFIEIDRSKIEQWIERGQEAREEIIRQGQLTSKSIQKVSQLLEEIRNR